MIKVEGRTFTCTINNGYNTEWVDCVTTEVDSEAPILAKSQRGMVHRAGSGCEGAHTSRKNMVKSQREKKKDEFYLTQIITSKFINQ